MKNFKPLEDFTFDDCVKSIERYKSNGFAPDDDLLERYNMLLTTLKTEERQDYSSATTIEGLQQYIKKYSNLCTSSKYQPQYLHEAKNKLDALRRELVRKRRFRIVKWVFACIIFICVVGMVGYRGPVTPDTPMSVSFSYFDQDTTFCIQGIQKYYTDCELEPEFLTIDRNGDYFTFHLSENGSGDRNMSIKFVSSDTFFKYPIGFNTKSKTLNVVQSHGTSDYLKVELDNERSYNYSKIGNAIYKIGWRGGESRFRQYPEDLTLLYPICFITHTNNRFFSDASVSDPDSFISPEWIKISRATRNGCDNVGEINLEIEPNDEWYDRKAIITIYDRESLHSEEITIIQESNPVRVLP